MIRLEFSCKNFLGYLLGLYSPGLISIELCFVALISISSIGQDCLYLILAVFGSYQTCSEITVSSRLSLNLGRSICFIAIVTEGGYTLGFGSFSFCI